MPVCDFGLDGGFRQVPRVSSYTKMWNTYLSDSAGESAGDFFADAGGQGRGGRGQFADDGLEADAGDVAELLLVGEHVAAQRVHDRLHLELLHFVHQRTQAEIKRMKFIEMFFFFFVYFPACHCLPSITAMLYNYLTMCVSEY